MVTIKSLLETARKQLKEVDIDTFAIDASLLLEEITGLSRTEILTQLEKEIDNQKAKDFQKLIEKRRARLSVAHLLGHKHFWKSDFQINKHTLIPRPETELLVEKAIEIIKERKPKSVSDIGTGSGNIIISLAQEFPGQNISWHATDISEQALETAEQNAEKLDTRINFHLGDLANPLPNNLDLVISNPPYVTDEEMTKLQPEVEKEPELALRGGSDGLDPYRQLFDRLKNKMSPNGEILLEHGYQQAIALTDLARETWPTCQTITYQDLAGRPRCLRISLSS